MHFGIYDPPNGYPVVGQEYYIYDVARYSTQFCGVPIGYFVIGLPLKLRDVEVERGWPTGWFRKV